MQLVPTISEKLVKRLPVENIIFTIYCSSYGNLRHNYQRIAFSLRSSILAMQVKDARLPVDIFRPV